MAVLHYRPRKPKIIRNGRNGRNECGNFRTRDFQMSEIPSSGFPNVGKAEAHIGSKKYFNSSELEVLSTTANSNLGSVDTGAVGAVREEQSFRA